MVFADDKGPSLDLLRTEHQLDTWGLMRLLAHLAVYPGYRIPLLSRWLQISAYNQWSVQWWQKESLLVDKLVTFSQDDAPQMTPADLFGMAAGICENDVFCAALICHNVLRTLGRHSIWNRDETGKDLNPNWLDERVLGYLPAIQTAMIDLQPNDAGDKWGQWYHIFGVMSWGLAAHATFTDTSTTPSPFAAFLTKKVACSHFYWARLWAGNHALIKKAQIDSDAADMTNHFVGLYFFGAKESSNNSTPCTEVSTYANFPLTKRHFSTK
jgi:hypothetical protein